MCKAELEAIVDIFQEKSNECAHYWVCGISCLWYPLWVVVIVCGMIHGGYTLTTTKNHYLVFLEGKWLTDTADMFQLHN